MAISDDLLVHPQTAAAFFNLWQDIDIDKAARAGEIKNFTGISSLYERPSTAELVLEAAVGAPEDCVERVEAMLKDRKIC